MGWFHIHAHSGNQYIMLAYHCVANVILVEPFQTHQDKDRIAAYNNIHIHL